MLEPISTVSTVSAVDSGNFSNKQLTRGLSQNNGTNGTNGTDSGNKTKSPPRSDMQLIVNARLAQAERGDPDALAVAQTYMAANAGYDWSEQLDKAERIAAEVIT